MPGGARAGRVLRLHTRGCPSLPSRCAVLSLRECQNWPDRCLQHQPAHLSLLLSPVGNQGCYAEAGYRTRWHWDQLSTGATGVQAEIFIAQVRELPAGTLFRHCVAGDQWPDPVDPLRIDQSLLLQLVRACRHLRAAWSFTHFPMEPANQATIRLAAAKGLVINASTESRSKAAALVRQGIPAVCVVPADAPPVFRHRGVRFVACPACRSVPSGRKRIQCINCGGRFGLPLCAQASREFVITFPAHGPRAAAAAAHCS